MWALLSPRLWIAVAVAGALAFSHLYVYKAGKQNVRTEWLAATATANADARKLETLRQSRVVEAQAVAAVRDARIRADVVRLRGESDGLRDTISAIRLHAKESGAAADNAVRVLSELFGSCTSAYTDLASEADRATSEVKTLRDAWPR